MFSKLKEFVNNNYKYLIIVSIALTVIMLILSFLSSEMNLEVFGKSVLYSLISVAGIGFFVLIITKIVTNTAFLKKIFIVFSAVLLLFLLTNIMSFASTGKIPADISIAVPTIVLIFLNVFRH